MALRSAAAALARRSASTLAHRRSAATPFIHSQYRATATATDVRADATTDACTVASTLASTQGSGAACLSLRPAANTSTSSYSIGSTKIPAAIGPIYNIGTLRKVPAAFAPRIQGHHASRIPATILGSRGSGIRAPPNGSGNPVAVFRRLLANGGFPQPPPEVQAAIKRLEDDWAKKHSKLESQVATLLLRSEDPEVQTLQKEVQTLQKQVQTLQKEVITLGSQAVEKHAGLSTQLADLRTRVVTEYCSSRVHKADSAFQIGKVAWRMSTGLLLFSVGTIVGVLQLVKSGLAAEQQKEIEATVNKLLAKSKIDNEATLQKILQEKVQVLNAQLFLQSNEEIGGVGSSTIKPCTICTVKPCINCTVKPCTNCIIKPCDGTHYTIEPCGGTDCTFKPCDGTNCTSNPGPGGGTGN